MITPKEALTEIKRIIIKMIYNIQQYDIGEIYFKNIDIEMVSMYGNVDNIETEFNDPITIMINQRLIYEIPLEYIIGMIAHEMGHIIYKHNLYLDKMNNSNYSFIKNGIEIQADLYGIRLLKLINYDPEYILKYLMIMKNSRSNFGNRDYNNYNFNIYNIIDRRINIIKKYINVVYSAPLF